MNSKVIANKLINLGYVPTHPEATIFENKDGHKIVVIQRDEGGEIYIPSDIFLDSVDDVEFAVTQHLPQ